ncbi:MULTISPECIES: NACHT domain-containing protein [unclassified Streptomyces]|uniref:NACHT domain-containing protein n=1 Tax=unclassified Streptomyces TaxID=2593676 RepID=UPI0035DEDD9A
MSLERSANHRVVVVQGAMQGTGVLLTPSLILTAAHVVRDHDIVRVGHPDVSGWITCQVYWRSSPRRGAAPQKVSGSKPEGTGSGILSLTPEAQRLRENPEPDLADGFGMPRREAERGRQTRDVDDTPTDLALLQAHTPVLPNDSTAMLRRLRWGTVASGDPLPHCQIVGFPAIQRRGDRQELEADQFEATVMPFAGRPRPVIVCEFSRRSVIEQDQAESPLAGLSGAPVFAGGVLIGIVTDVPRGRDHSRVEAVPISLLPAERLPYDRQLPAVMEEVTELHRGDEPFEARYSKAVKDRYRKIEVIGIEELSNDESRWDLDAAYLALEAEQSSSRRGSDVPAHPRRINSLLTGSESVILLRGEAGAGKTTLAWWLASHAACATFGPQLAHFNGLVPFVIPMRTLRAQGGEFPTPKRLPQIAGLVADDPPEGWASRVLEAGRALLLVDGLDEVPQEDRQAARRWLIRLLESFDHVRCMVTMRPLAVEGDGDWLGMRDGVLSLRLLSMRDSDIQKFVHVWHNAARLELSSTSRDHAEITRLEKDLAQQFAANPALRDLARTPLLCAVICALHRRRRGLLPTSRTALYRAALDMLVNRDPLRGVVAPEGINIEAEEHRLLLQRIATWLVRNGLSQLTYEQAQRQLQDALRGMPRVAEQGTAERILRHVLNRSGLLQERAEGSIQFIHRTFQDYLAAKELLETDHVGELMQHAAEQEWEDVIQLAAGQCNTRSGLRQILDSLIRQGDGASAWEQWKLWMLAANCALTAVYLDEDIRDRVAARVKSLMPPTSTVQSAELAKLGTYVLPLLPAFETLSEEQGLLVLDTLNKIGTSDCLPSLRSLAQQSNRAVRQTILNDWDTFPVPAADYLSEVLAHMRLDDLEFVIGQPDRLHHLQRLQGIRRLQLHASTMHPEDLETVPKLPALRELRIASLPSSHMTRLPPPHPGVARLSVDSHGTLDLDGLSGWTGLHGLALWQQVPVYDLFERLAELPRLRAVQLPLASPVVALESVPVLPTIRALTLPSLAEGGDLRQLARVFPSLTRLTLHPQPSTAHSVDLTPFAHHQGLQVFVVHGRQRPAITGAETFGDRLHVTQASDVPNAESVLRRAAHTRSDSAPPTATTTPSSS